MKKMTIILVTLTLLIVSAVNFGILTKQVGVNVAYACNFQDRRMDIIICTDGRGNYTYGFNCYYPGNECYYSRYCFW